MLVKIQTLRGASGTVNVAAMVGHRIRHSTALQHSHSPVGGHQRDAETQICTKFVCGYTEREMADATQKCARSRANKTNDNVH